MNKCLNFEAVVSVDNNIAIGAINDGNAIYKIDMYNGEASYIASFPKEKPNGKRLYCSAAFFDNKVFFVPNAATNIAILNLDDNSIESLPVKEIDREENRNYKPKFKFADCIICGLNLYFISATYPAIVCMNMKTYNIKYIEGWANEDSFFFRKGKCVVDNMVYVPSCENGIILTFDTISERIELIRLPYQSRGFWSIIHFGGEFWLAPKGLGSIVKFIPDGFKCVEFDNYPSKTVKKKFMYTKTYVFNDNICFVPADSQAFIQVNPKNGKVDENNICSINECDWIDYMFDLDEYIYLRIKGSNTKCRYARLNTNMNTLEEYKITADINEYVENLFGNISGSIVQEDSSVCIGDFLEYCLNGR